MGTLKVWLDERTKKIDATITELKKHGKGRISRHDALYLIKKHDELQDKKRALEQALKQVQTVLQRAKVKVNVVESFEDFTSPR